MDLSGGARWMVNKQAAEILNNLLGRGIVRVFDTFCWTNYYLLFFFNQLDLFLKLM